jgi:hypothetical protein
MLPTFMTFRPPLPSTARRPSSKAPVVSAGRVERHAIPEKGTAGDWPSIPSDGGAATQIDKGIIPVRTELQTGLRRGVRDQQEPDEKTIVKIETSLIVRSGIESTPQKC